MEERAPELFLQQFADLKNPSTVGQASTGTIPSGAYFVDLLSSELAGSFPSDLSSNGLPFGLLPDTPPALPNFPLFPPLLVPDPTPPAPPPPEPPPDLNSAPAIAGADTTGAVIEDVPPSGWAGVVAFSDSDLTDVHSVSVTPAGSGYLGTFAATITDDATGDGSGVVTLNFSADNAACNSWRRVSSSSKPTR